MNLNEEKNKKAFVIPEVEIKEFSQLEDAILASTTNNDNLNCDENYFGCD